MRRCDAPTCAVVTHSRSRLSRATGELGRPFGAGRNRLRRQAEGWHPRWVVDSDTYRSLAEAAWRWVLTQVRGGGSDLWLPDYPSQTAPGDYPYGMHSGVGGLAHVISEIRLSRDLTREEAALREGIPATLVRRIPDTTQYDYFDGLVST